jgi:peptidoglycan hydrolase-like protein with peptidoglycan-binding domain
MAFIDADNTGEADIPYFYNLTSAVGGGRECLKEDVMLVQYFLKKIYEHKNEIKNKPYGEMVVDGKFGPITRNWILSFQIRQQANADGIVDKASNQANNRMGSISKTIYTIRLLNNGMRILYREFYRTLPYQQEVPADLRLALLQMHAESWQVVAAHPLKSKASAG